MSRITDADHALKVAEAATALFAALATVPAVRATSWSERDDELKRRDAALTSIKTRLAAGEIGPADITVGMRDDWQGARLKLWGLSATSTSDFHGAATNWIAQARAKVAAWHAAQAAEAAE